MEQIAINIVHKNRLYRITGDVVEYYIPASSDGRNAGRWILVQGTVRQTVLDQVNMKGKAHAA